MTGEEKSAYRNKWIAETYDRINLTVPKGKKEELKAIAQEMGMSVNEFINVAINEKLGID